MQRTDGDLVVGGGDQLAQGINLGRIVDDTAHVEGHVADHFDDVVKAGLLKGLLDVGHPEVEVGCQQDFLIDVAGQLLFDQSDLFIDVLGRLGADVGADEVIDAEPGGTYGNQNGQQQQDVNLDLEWHGIPPEERAGTANPPCQSLFLLGVLHGVQCHRQNDDAALDDELPVRADADIGQTIVDQGEDKYAGDHTCDSSHPAGKRHPAHHARRDGIQLVHEAEVVGGTTDPACFQHAAEGVEDPSQRIDHHQIDRHVDAGDLGCLGIAADGEDVLAKAGLVPQHPDKDAGDGRVEGEIGELEAADPDKALGEAGEAGVKTGHRRGPHRVEVEGVDTVDDDHGPQGCDKGGHVQIGDDKAVDQTYQGTHHAHQQDHRRNGHLPQRREHLVDVGQRLQHGRRNQRRQTDLTAGREIRPLGDDDTCHPQRDNDPHRGLGQDVAEVGETQEGGFLDHDDHEQHQQHHVDAVLLERPHQIEIFSRLHKCLPVSRGTEMPGAVSRSGQFLWY